MPTVDVLDLNKRKVGSAELPTEVFGCKPHATLVHEAVVMQRACERQGTASTLRRGEVRGSGKKPWKQKHTGRARAGSVFGPKPRSYAFNMPKKKYRTALQSALSSKVTDGQLFVVSSLSLEQPKTKVLAKALQLFAAGAQVLVIAGEGQDGLLQAARNLSKVQVVTPDRLNVYDIVRAGTIVIPERALARVKEVWA
jgi:large subunit ribosomal protein L4